MTEKTWSREQVDSIVAEVAKLDGLPDAQVSAEKGRLEAKYDLPAGFLSKSNSSSITLAELERQKIYQQHYEATVEEIDKMSMPEYQRWSALGGHIKKPAEEVQRDIAAEEADRARTEEMARIDNMSVEEYKAYTEQKALKAQQEKQEAARVIAEQEQKKVSALRHKRPEDMSMAEYEAWTKIR